MKSKLLLALSLTAFQVSLLGCGLVGNDRASDVGGSGTVTDSEQVSDSSDGNDSEFTAGWVDFQTPNGLLSAKFPGTPETSSQTTPSELGDLEFSMTSYSDDEDTQFFMVSSVTYPVSPEQYDAATGLESAKEGAVSNSGSTLVVDENIERFGLPGKELVMTAAREDGEEYMTRAEIYIDPKGPTLHQVLLVTEGDLINSASAEAFFDSIAIKPL